jgi:hypothetical protein
MASTRDTVISAGYAVPLKLITGAGVKPFEISRNKIW